MFSRLTHNDICYSPAQTGAKENAMAWQDRGCKGCGNQFAPTSKTQQYCETCSTQCRIPGCDMKVRARGYCAAHLRQTHPVVAIPMRDGGLCGVDSCERSAFAKGHCQFHYDRVRFYRDAGDATPKARQPRGQPCSVDGCEKAATGDGLCPRHYKRRTKTGDVGPAELLRREMGTGSITEDGYKVIVVDGEYVYEHRHLMRVYLGRDLYPGENVHHKNGNRIDNSEENLEVWISQQPPGQRVTDLVEFAIKILRQYPDALADEGFRLMPLESIESTKALMGEPAFNDAAAYLRGLLANS